ncbi:MAG: hypothetical protein WBG50_14640 [Desulfomonilaceae bacterium]
MKKSFVLVVITALCAAAFTAGASQAQKQEAPRVHWLTDLGAGLRQAKLENKPVLLDFFNPN